MTEVKEIPVEKIQAGEHAQRMEVEDAAIDELAASIRRIGIINPLVVTDVDGTYRIVAGHRRWMAARKIGMARVPCVVRDAERGVDTEVSFAENLFRKDL